MAFFPDIEKIPYVGTASANPLSFHYYDAEKKVRGKSMAEHLRFAVCYWHSFAAPGDDVFGDGTWDRPWGNDVAGAQKKLAAAFEFFEKLGVAYFCFHDRDIAPEGATVRETEKNLRLIADEMATAIARSGVALLWGTANLFGHPRYAAGAATNPNPDVFAFAADQVKTALELTHELEGQNYVLWGGREGYDTLLNTDLRRESDQLGRFMEMVAEHKQKIGFEGTLLIEPKPCEPTKHQYDFDAASCFAFLQKYDLEKEFKLNIECNHATLAGHSFHHEVAYAIAHDLFGSIDANRGDPQNGWDTDQFPTNAEEFALVLYEILLAGGFSNGGLIFDAKLSRQSVAREDLFHAHIGGMDTVARAFDHAIALYETQVLANARAERYAGWQSPIGQSIQQRKATLETRSAHVHAGDMAMEPVSGRQEELENLVARAAR